MTADWLHGRQDTELIEWVAKQASPQNGDHTANSLFLHGSDDDNFTRRLETVMSLIFAKLALNLLPGFRACGLGQRCEHLVQSAKRVSLETNTFLR